VIACGALAGRVRAIAAGHGWPVDVYPLPAALHNRPERIAAEVAALAAALRARHRVIALAYADCGTYGALDDACRSLGLARLPGETCYDVLAGRSTMERLFAEEPGTYVLTDFVVQSFHTTVWKGLGLDRRPELRDDYFGNYRRVVWLAERRSEALEERALDAASALGLPLEIVDVGGDRLEHALQALIEGLD
jgi:hypothetical protein